MDLLCEEVVACPCEDFVAPGIVAGATVAARLAAPVPQFSFAIASTHAQTFFNRETTPPAWYTCTL